MVNCFTDLLAGSRVEPTQVMLGERHSGKLSAASEVGNGLERDLKLVVLAGQEVIGPQTLSLGGTLELGYHCVF